MYEQVQSGRLVLHQPYPLCIAIEEEGRSHLDLELHTELFVVLVTALASGHGGSNESERMFMPAGKFMCEADCPEFMCEADCPE
jgi:hypothetical protein